MSGVTRRDPCVRRQFTIIVTAPDAVILPRMLPAIGVMGVQA